jgi:hypothetical protein
MGALITMNSGLRFCGSCPSSVSAASICARTPGRVQCALNIRRPFSHGMLFRSTVRRLIEDSEAAYRQALRALIRSLRRRVPGNAHHSSGRWMDSLPKEVSSLGRVNTRLLLGSEPAFSHGG